MFMLKFSNKNMFFLHEIDKLMSVLMSIEWWNKERQPLATLGSKIETGLVYLYSVSFSDSFGKIVNKKYIFNKKSHTYIFHNIQKL